jgi:hypothetical protein
MDDTTIVDCASGQITQQSPTADDIAQAETDTAAAVEQQWAQLRATRDGRLTASDWTQLADTELTAEDVQAWSAYRQALRDLPDNTTDPANPDWPEPPPTPAERASA